LRIEKNKVIILEQILIIGYYFFKFWEACSFMSFEISSPMERYQAARDHFNSAGLGAEKIILLVVLALVIAIAVYAALRK
jgi:hypothetical protein